MKRKVSNFEEVKALPAFPSLLEELTPTMVECLNTHGQIGINSIAGFEHDHTMAIGSLIKDWDNLKIITTGAVTEYEIPDKTEKLHEQDFTVLCNIFRNTAFEEIYNILNKKYIIGRLRLFKSEPKTCLSWHTDKGPSRLHYPIKTQPGCFMVIEDEVKHMEQNKWWITDTSKPHSAFNGSKESRIHLVAVIRGLR